MKPVPFRSRTTAAAVVALLLTSCSFSTAPGTILGPHVGRDADPTAKTTPAAHTSHRAKAFGGWTPSYYHDRLMFYDDMGQPFFYAGNKRVFLSNSSPQYSVARDQWQRNQYAYDRWHAVYHKPRYLRSRR